MCRVRRDALDARAETKRMVEKAQAIIAKIEADERFHYPPANTDVNALLALTQVSMNATKRCAERILGACVSAQGKAR